MMEQWNNGMVGNTIGFPIFQNSIIPIFQPFSLSALHPPRMKRKSTAEYAEIAELFLGKDKKHKAF